MGTYNHLKDTGKIEPDDIIVEIDGDDWLLHPFVLQYLNQVYQNKDIWMTYGQYLAYPTGEYGGHIHLSLDDYVDQHNIYRYAEFPYSHLKTYKAWLFDKVPREYLIDPRTEKYWKTTADFAMCMPMVEMAGKERIIRFDQPMYVYNTSDDLGSESKTNLAAQKEAERLIRQFKPLEKL